MPDISTLRDDVYDLLNRGNTHEPSPELAVKYAMSIGANLAKATKKKDEPRVPTKLWASDLGKDCMRKHWFTFNHPELAEQLAGPVTYKFLYGNIIEDSTLYLTEEAGHEVDGLQQRVEYRVDCPDSSGQTTITISGRIDAVIDGVLVDVKSTSTYGYKQTEQAGGIQRGGDKFGYLWQLSFYWNNYPSTGAKPPEEAGFLWIDRDRGEFFVDKCTSLLYGNAQIQQRACDIYKAAKSPQVPPRDPKYDAVPQSATSPNMKLCTECSYCDFKLACWKDANKGAGLRKFVYSNGPTWLTEVHKTPNVWEENVYANQQLGS